MSSERSTGWARRFVEVFHGPVIARVVLAAAIILTATAWWFSHSLVDRAAEDRFESRAGEIESAVHERMIGYEQVLWGGVGLFEASELVSRDGWAAYVAALDLDEHWPGIQGMGLAVPVDDVIAHEAAIRGQGFPDYQITPVEERDEYTSIIYLEPFDWRNQRAFGFDMWSNEVRRAAMSRARLTGEAATSGRITLVQETDEDVQPGFLTYVPLFLDREVANGSRDPEDGFVGWVYAAFRMNDLMEGILGDGVEDVDYEIYDGTEPNVENLLYDSNDVVEADAIDEFDLHRVTTVDVQGRPWTFVFHPGRAFAAGGSESLPTTVAIAGITIDLLLFLVISSLGMMNKRVARQVDERTVELQAATVSLEVYSAELEQQAAALKRSNAELEQFAYIASHDLQEPLRTMGSFADLLDKRHGQDLGDDARRWLAYITDGSQRLSGLVHDLLAFASIGADMSEPEPVPLDQVLDAALVDLEEAIAETGAAVERAASLPVVVGSRTQLERLFQNLISNGMKYCADGSTPIITVSAEECEGHLCRVVVRDNGIGIKADYHERIFEVFRRVGPRSKYSGTGVGLAICRKVIEAHGGSIGVESAPGQGSEFWFTLPIATSLALGDVEEVPPHVSTSTV